ncbi:MAG TPA: hypothetical protein GX505_01310 [Clostridiales bacterium]|nr:hypothetical protein [Clostridiales bacterium]
MKNSMRVIIICLIVLLLSVMTGCQLAKVDGAENYNNEDRLIGVFITTEYLDLFDFEGYINDNIGSLKGNEVMIGSNAAQYQGRLYAELRQKTVTNEETGEEIVTEEYIFPNYQGIFYYSARVPGNGEHEGYITTGSDEEISDGHVSINSSDQGESISMEGTVYVTHGTEKTYFFNPVYQSRDNRVYAVTGSGYFFSDAQAEGTSFSQTMESTYTTTKNGEKIIDSISVKISFNFMHPPEKIAVLQMSADGFPVLRKEYSPGEMPKSIDPEKDTDYFIVETIKAGSNDEKIISRKLYGRDSDSIEAFYCREDGICIKQWVQINWDRQ